MISKHKKAQMLDYLAKGISHRKISTLLHVSRGTVGNYARGKIPRRKAEPPDDQLTFWDLDDYHYERCPQCGGMVIMPCLACQLANMKMEREQGIF